MSRELRPEGVIYRIDEAIGQGLSATVYRAVREDSRGFARQTVALKILKSENAVPWLRREFETLSRVRSPNCVRVLGWENLPEGCALVLEWIDGVSLLELARGRILPEPARNAVVAQIQNGLRALSNERLFHGDLSPANVLIDRDGVVKLIDFATPSQEEQGPLGTLEYLSPEVWLGGRKTLAGDLFSLGLIAWDLDNGFADHPLAPLQARSRCESFSRSGTGWFSREQDQRGFIALAVDPSGQAELARAVREFLASRIRIETAAAPSNAPSTAAPKAKKRRVREQLLRRSACLANRGHQVVRAKLERGLSRFREVFQITPFLRASMRGPTLASVLAISFLLIGASRADAPPLENSHRGTLEVRSMRWLEVSLNGRRIGYAPVRVQNLHPGRHHLSWKSATGAGEAMVLIKPGATVLLREQDLIARQSRGARVLAEPSLKD